MADNKVVSSLLDYTKRAGFLKIQLEDLTLAVPNQLPTNLKHSVFPNEVMLRGYLIKTEKDSDTKPTLLYFPGRNVRLSGKTGSYLLDAVKKFDVNILAFDTRCHGRSDCGEFHPENLVNDAMSIYKHLVKNAASAWNLDSTKFIVGGYSMGCAVAHQLMDRITALKAVNTQFPQPAGFLLLSPFASVPKIFDYSPFMKSARLTGNLKKYNTLFELDTSWWGNETVAKTIAERISQWTTPFRTLILATEMDEFVGEKSQTKGNSNDVYNALWTGYPSHPSYIVFYKTKKFRHTNMGNLKFKDYTAGRVYNKEDDPRNRLFLDEEEDPTADAHLHTFFDDVAGRNATTNTLRQVNVLNPLGNQPSTGQGTTASSSTILSNTPISPNNR